MLSRFSTKRNFQYESIVLYFGLHNPHLETIDLERKYCQVENRL